MPDITLNHRHGIKIKKMIKLPRMDLFAGLIIRFLSLLPANFYKFLAWLGGKILDLKKGQMARAAIRLTQPHITEEQCNQIAKESACYTLQYLLSLPRLKKIRYQLHDIDVIRNALADDRGAVVISLHLGPPDLGALAITRQGFPATTLIGAGKQSPFTNSLGRHALELAGIDFIQRGDPTAVVRSIKQKKIIFLYSDLRSKEMPVTFFDQETSAPASGIIAAQLFKAPILFHHCTMKDGVWQLYFERFEPVLTGDNKADAAKNLQSLMHKMASSHIQTP